MRVIALHVMTRSAPDDAISGIAPQSAGKAAGCNGNLLNATPDYAKKWVVGQFGLRIALLDWKGTVETCVR